MPHIEYVKTRNKTYLRIAESYYDNIEHKQKKRVIKNLGDITKYDDGEPNFLERFREKFKNEGMVIDGISYQGVSPNTYSFTTTYNSSKHDYSVDFKNLGYIFLNLIYSQIGISEVLRDYRSRHDYQIDIAGITRLLVFSRILSPASKSSTYQMKDDFFKPIVSGDTSLQSVYDTLTILANQSSAIQTRMNTRIAKSGIGRKTDLTYYDVTNYYYETMYGDEDVLDENGEVVKVALRKKGVSKEHRPEPIVQMGLFMDEHGIPVSFNLFPGNMQDKTTLTQMLHTNQLLPSNRTIVVADNGMHSQENLYLLVKEGNGYIVSKSVKQCWKSYRDWIENESGYECLQSSDGTVTFKYKSRIHERVVGDKNGNKITIKEKEIVYWSLAHYRREAAQNQKFIEYLESCKDHPDKLKDRQRKTAEFISITQIDPKTGDKVRTKTKIELNEEKIQKYKDTMGYYMIVTSEIDTPDRDIINKYHGLSRIEDSFRIIKSDLEGRPIYVRTNEHIKAHFLICFIALTLIRILQYKLLNAKGQHKAIDTDGWKQGMTADRIKKALSNYKVATDKNGVCIVTGTNEDIKTIYDSFKVKYKMSAPTSNEIKKLIVQARRGAKL